MYKTLRQEQLSLQKRMETLYRWTFAAAAIVWGFMLNNHKMDMNYLIGLAPAVLAPFIYHWVTNLAYSAHRIAIYIKSNCEDDILRVQGWEQWLNMCRVNSSGAHDESDHKTIKDLLTSLMEKLKRLQTYNMIFPFIIIISPVLSIIRVLDGDNTDGDGFRLLTILLVFLFSLTAFCTFRLRHLKLIEEIKKQPLTQ